MRVVRARLQEFEGSRWRSCADTVKRAPPAVDLKQGGKLREPPRDTTTNAQAATWACWFLV